MFRSRTAGYDSRRQNYDTRFDDYEDRLNEYRKGLKNYHADLSRLDRPAHAETLAALSTKRGSLVPEKKTIGH